MQTLKCEMCGSSEMVKQDGLFACQVCHTKYSVEEAKKMMGVVAIDKSGEADNLLARAEQFFNGGYTHEANEYINRILDIDANHAGAYALIERMQKAQCDAKLREKIDIYTKAIEDLYQYNKYWLGRIKRLPEEIKGHSNLEAKFKEMCDKILPQNLEYDKNTNLPVRLSNKWQISLIHANDNQVAEFLKPLKTRLINEYINLAEKGDVLFLPRSFTGSLWNDRDWIGVFSYYNSVLLEFEEKGKANATQLKEIPLFWVLDYLGVSYYENCKFDYFKQNSRLKLWASDKLDSHVLFFINGKTVGYSVGRDEGRERIHLKQSELLINDKLIAEIKNHFTPKVRRLDDELAKRKKTRLSSDCLLCGKYRSKKFGCSCIGSNIDSHRTSLAFYLELKDAGLCTKCGEPVQLGLFNKQCKSCGADQKHK